MDNEKIKLFVPGRVCLFGEHSDWAGGYRRIDSTVAKGYCLIIGTDQGIRASVSSHPDKLVIDSTLPDGRKLGAHSLEMAEDKLVECARGGGFYSYCAGVAYQILKRHRVGGVKIDSDSMNLPIRKGLSSSAAVCVLTARAFNRLYDLKLTIRGEMELAYLGEITTPSRCGRMDQGCAYGKIPVFLTFDGDDMEIDELHPRSDIHMLIVDLRAGKNTMKILADLNSCYPQGMGKIGEDVRYYLGPVNAEILADARKAVEQGDAEQVGTLMTEAQRLFDQFMAPACPSELTAPTLHKVLSYPGIQELIWGGKGVGSQGDGCAQFVARGKEEREELKRRLAQLDVGCFDLDIEAVPDRQPQS